MGEGRVSGEERSKSGEGIKSEDKLKRTMHEKQPKKRSKRRYTRREEGSFAAGSIYNKRNTDVNKYTDCQSAYDIYLFNYPGSVSYYFVFPFFFSPVYFADSKKTVTLPNALVVIFTEPL